MSNTCQGSPFVFFSAKVAKRYVDRANGDELAAALTVARERNAKAGAYESADELEVHHALFIIRRALGESAPSYDDLRVRLRERERSNHGHGVASAAPARR